MILLIVVQILYMYCIKTTVFDGFAFTRAKLEYALRNP